MRKPGQMPSIGDSRFRRRGAAAPSSWDSGLRGAAPEQSKEPPLSLRPEPGWCLLTGGTSERQGCGPRAGQRAARPSPSTAREPGAAVPGQRDRGGGTAVFSEFRTGTCLWGHRELASA